jgi:sugar phosphate isomerase/epimerase
MPKIFIQPNNTNFVEFLKYATETGCNMEIASFAFAQTLDSDWKEILDDYQKKLKDFKGIISIHGAFQDLILHSRDNKIGEIAKSRYTQNLEIAKALNATYIVFHGNFNPLIGHESYNKNWIEQNTLFWSDALKKFDITILIENVWESSPEIFLILLGEVNSSQLKICFDTGHANIFSHVPIKDWFESLGNNIAYIHVNDNKGDVDNELVPGEGTVNWREFSDNIIKFGVSPNIVFEVGSLDKTKRAIKYFMENKIYPYNK